MGDRVWVCTREPFFDWLSAPLHPCVILMLWFAGLSLGARGFSAEHKLVRELWRYLLLAGVSVWVAFAFTAALARFGFSADPSPIVGAVPLARGVSAALVAGVAWRRRHLGVPLPWRAKSWFRGRWLVLCASLVLAARPWISNTNWLVSGPFEIAEGAVDASTNYIASDQCLASRVIEYSAAARISASLSWIVGEGARNELDWRGARAVPGISELLNDRLDLDALQPDYLQNHRSSFYGRGTPETIRSRAISGIRGLLTDVGMRIPV